MSEKYLDLSGARVLVVDDVPASLGVMTQALEGDGYQVLVATSGERALEIAAGAGVDLVLMDVVMPVMDGLETCQKLKADPATREIPVIFLTARDEAAGIARGFAAGGEDYLVKPLRNEEVLIRVRAYLERARLARGLAENNRQLAARTRELEERSAELEQANHTLKAEIEQRQTLTSERNHLADQLSLISRREAERWGVDGIIGRSQSLQKILADIRRLQNADAVSVMITGESGTGKELIARAFHAASGRAQGPFMPVNCASIPAELAASLLFGHVRGSFSGALKDQAGYFELADGGTLFLDEIGDMPVDLQVQLLRVLEDGQVRPIGAEDSRAVDVRVLAATNADLERKIAAGSFREDLYYRLARFAVEVPPLRRRTEDIPLLAQHFLEIFAVEMGLQTPALSDEALSALDRYDYPGNVRELKNIIERALIESQGGPIEPQHLHWRPAAQSQDGPKPIPAEQTADELVAELPLNFAQAETALVKRALEAAGGNVSEAARLLGIDRNKVYRKLKQENLLD